MKSLVLSAAVLLATSTSMAGVYRCPITSSDLQSADTVTLIQDCRDSMTMKITGQGQTLVTKTVNYDYQNSDENVMMFKSADRKTFLYVEKDHVGLKAQVSALNYMIRTNYCQQIGW